MGGCALPDPARLEVSATIKKLRRRTPAGSGSLGSLRLAEVAGEEREHVLGERLARGGLDVGGWARAGLAVEGGAVFRGGGDKGGVDPLAKGPAVPVGDGVELVEALARRPEDVLAWRRVS